MKSKATLKQIANELGVAVSTVSKALSDSPEISELTKQRIQEYATLRNYKPNALAQRLKSQQTKTIGVVIPNILNPFFAKVFSGIEKTANERGYTVITYISNESFVKEKQALDLLSNGVVDGFILSVAEESQRKNLIQHFVHVLRDGMPIVMFDRALPEVKCSQVVVDDVEACKEAVRYLVHSGCKNIVFLSCIENLSVGQLRAEGYLQALKDLGKEIHANQIIRTNSEESFNERIEKLLKEEKYDAFLCADEHSSTYVMKRCLQIGKKIPDQISVIGFADGIWSRRLTPSLSTISQHGPEIGAAAAKLLIDEIEANQKGEKIAPQKVIIRTELRKRDSVKK
ncbi:MAG: LacI family DNA-binding transcriptional regulator [Flavobacterium sp.]